MYRFCSPTRASFLTGRIPGHGIWETNPYIDAMLGTNLNLTMIPAKLKQAGCKERSTGAGWLLVVRRGRAIRDVIGVR